MSKSWPLSDDARFDGGPIDPPDSEEEQDDDDLKCDVDEDTYDEEGFRR